MTDNQCRDSQRCCESITDENKVKLQQALDTVMPKSYTYGFFINENLWWAWAYDANKHLVTISVDDDVVGYVYFDDTAGCHVMQFKVPLQDDQLDAYLMCNKYFRVHKRRYGA